MFCVQEPGPAKVAVTGSGIPEAEKVPDSSSIIWQEELNQREAEGAAVWAAADLPPASPLPSTGKGEYNTFKVTLRSFTSELGHWWGVFCKLKHSRGIKGVTYQV